MVCSARSPGATGVALLAEGVDRNDNDQIIELAALRVALLAEGVDRNCEKFGGGEVPACRPPRGGRG